MAEKKILTTHVGSLIRPPELLPFIRAKQNKEPYDADAYAKMPARLGRRGGEAAGGGGGRHSERRRVRQGDQLVAVRARAA